MASSDEEIEELIEDVSVVSGDDDASVAEEIDVEGAFEGDVENSDDESIVGTKKKKLMPHTQTVDRSIESEEEDVIENQKTSRRNSKRKGAEKTEDNRKTEDDHEVLSKNMAWFQNLDKTYSCVSNMSNFFSFLSLLIIYSDLDLI